MVASKTSILVAAVALGAASVCAAPTPFSKNIALSRREADEPALIARDFEHDGLYAREFDDLDARDFEDDLEARDFDELFARDHEDLEARDFDEHELEARDFDEHELEARDFDDDEDLSARGFEDDEEDLYARGFDDDEEDLYARGFDGDEELFARAAASAPPSSGAVPPSSGAIPPSSGAVPPASTKSTGGFTGGFTGGGTQGTSIAAPNSAVPDPNAAQGGTPNSGSLVPNNQPAVPPASTQSKRGLLSLTRRGKDGTAGVASGPDDSSFSATSDNSGGSGTPNSVPPFRQSVVQQPKISTSKSTGSTGNTGTNSATKFGRRSQGYDTWKRSLADSLGLDEDYFA